VLKRVGRSPFVAGSSPNGLCFYLAANTYPKPKKQLKTQTSLGIEHIAVTAKQKIQCFLDLSPPKKQKNQP